MLFPVNETALFPARFLLFIPLVEFGQPVQPGFQRPPELLVEVVHLGGTWAWPRIDRDGHHQQITGRIQKGEGRPPLKAAQVAGLAAQAMRGVIEGAQVFLDT